MGNTNTSKTVGNSGSRLACGNIQLVSDAPISGDNSYFEPTTAAPVATGDISYFEPTTAAPVATPESDPTSYGETTEAAALGTNDIYTGSAEGKTASFVAIILAALAL